MKKITESKNVYGKLLTVFGQFDLLAPEPEKYNLPWYLRDGAFSFYIVDTENVARHIIVKGDFGIIPFPVPEQRSVDFLLDDTEGENNLS